MCLAGRLKDLACLIALQSTFKSPLIKIIKENLSYLPCNILARMLKFIKRFPQLASGDTFHNVNAVINEFVEEILKPIFTGK
jgi:hypothetical protein